MLVLRPGSVIQLTARDEADSRTKERITENESKGFVVRECVMSSEALGGKPGLLLESLNSDGKRGNRWMGWIASDCVDLV